MKLCFISDGTFVLHPGCSCERCTEHQKVDALIKQALLVVDEFEKRQYGSN